jgi:hypothetical protein
LEEVLQVEVVAAVEVAAADGFHDVMLAVSQIQTVLF